MRTFCDSNSIGNCEPSKAAILESILVSAFVLWMLAETQNLKILLVWASIGWVFLLRTEISTRRTLLLYEKPRKVLDKFLSWILDETKLHEIRSSTTKIHWGRESYSFNGAPPGANAAAGEGILYFFEWAIKTAFQGVMLPVGFLTFLVGNFVAATISKLLATVWTFASNPIQTLSSVAVNWQRFAICIDVNHPIEFVPGYSTYVDRSPVKIDDVRWVTLRRELQDQGWGMLCVVAGVGALFDPLGLTSLVISWTVQLLEWFSDLGSFAALTTFLLYVAGFSLLLFSIPVTMRIIFTSPLRLLLFIPAYVYRFTVKTMWIAYYPLSWVFPFAKLKLLSPSGKRESNASWEITKSAVLSSHIITISLSLLFIVFFTSKYLLINDVKVSVWFFNWLCESDACEIIVDAFAQPNKIPAWHMVAFANAILSIAILVWIKYVWGVNDPSPAQNTDRVSAISRFLAFSGALSVFVWAANVVIATRLVRKLQIPEVFDVGFPEVGCIFPLFCG